MTFKDTLFILSSIITIALSSCNNDIFVDEINIDQDEIVIDGDGGTATITIPTSNLKRYGFYLYEGENFTYYDADGKVMTDYAGRADIARINYSGVWLNFDVYRDKNKLTFTSTENAGNTSTFTLFLDYGYTVKRMKLKINAGQTMSISDFEYRTAEAHTVDTVLTRSYTTHLVNDDDTACVVGIEPYQTLKAMASFVTLQSWLNTWEYRVQIPALVDGKWQLGDEYKIIFGAKMYYTTEDRENPTIYPIKIAAHSKVGAKVTVSYETIVVPFTVTTTTPVTKRTYSVDGVCAVSEPVDYNVTVTDEN